MFTFARGIFHLRFSVVSSQETWTAPFKFSIEGASKGYFF